MLQLVHIRRPVIEYIHFNCSVHHISDQQAPSIININGQKLSGASQTVDQQRIQPLSLDGPGPMPDGGSTEDAATEFYWTRTLQCIPDSGPAEDTATECRQTSTLECIPDS